MGCLRSTTIFFLWAIVVSGFYLNTALSEERPWYRYENAYFEVTSDASEKRVRQLAMELESFRAALDQTLAWSIPRSATKTRFIVFHSDKDLGELTGERHIASYIESSDGSLLFAMSAKPSSQSMYIFRHMFTHAVLTHSQRDFPPWFREGLAEFMSAIEFVEEATKFTYGDMALRRLSGISRVPWTELLSVDFSFDAIKLTELKSNAYCQSWLLAHYMLMQNARQNDTSMAGYFGRLESGESSASAFRAEFGMTPTEFGRYVEAENTKPTPYYTVNVDNEIPDTDFVRSHTDPNEIEESLSNLREKFASKLVSGTEYLPLIPTSRTGYEPLADPNLLLAAAQDEAASKNKKVLVIAGGDWCVWCHYLDAFLKSHDDIFAAFNDTFVVAKVYVGGRITNREFFRSLPKTHGYPHFWILSPSGEVLASQSTARLEKGNRTYDPAAFREFIDRWR